MKTFPLALALLCAAPFAFGAGIPEKYDFAGVSAQFDFLQWENARRAQPPKKNDPRRLIKAGNSGKVAQSFYFSNLSCKDKLVELRRNESHKWELPADISPDYVKQLGNEYRSESGNGKPIWLRKGSRPNHYFDCETMQVCAAFMNKLFEEKTEEKP